MSKKKTHFETIIDLDALNDTTEVRFDIDPEDLPKGKKAKQIEEQDDDLDDEEEFSFPQEDFEVELEDQDEEPEEDQDTPPKKKPKEQETPEEITEREQAASKQRKSAAQERIRELANKNKLILQESLAKETESRRKDEEIISLKKRMAESDAAQAASELEQAKYNYARAFEEGDPAKVAEANSALSTASMKAELSNLKRNQTSNLSYDEAAHTQRVNTTQQELQDTNQYQTEEVPEIDVKSQRWLKRNKFIFTNQGLTEAAGILFDQLKDDGYDTTEYDTYKELEERMIALYPNTERLFKRKVKNDEYSDMDEPEEAPNLPKKQAPPVANANRTLATPTASAPEGNYRVDNKGKIKYKPTRDDVDMAKRMGVPIDTYVKNKIAIDRNTQAGSKYTQIF